MNFEHSAKRTLESQPSTECSTSKSRDRHHVTRIGSCHSIRQSKNFSRRSMYDRRELKPFFLKNFKAVLSKTVIDWTSPLTFLNTQHGKNPLKFIFVYSELFQLSTMKLLFVALVVLSVAGSQAANLCTSSATYKVDISCKWTEERHPKDYPADNPPHFTVMCGTAHNSNYTLWSVGSIATLGLKEAAELGYCSMLEDEINDCTKEGSCATNGFFDWHCNPTLGNVCTFKGKVTVTPEYQSVSMMSMMVPSPDWAVGLDSINLCRMGKAFWLSFR